MEPHFHHYHLENERRASVREDKHQFFNKNGSNNLLRKIFHVKSKLQVKDTSTTPQKLLSHLSTHFFTSTLCISHPTTTFPHWTLHKTFKLILACTSCDIQEFMNFTQFWIKSCFLVVSHIQINFHAHISELNFFLIKFLVLLMEFIVLALKPTF